MDRKYANGFQVENVGLNMRRFSWPTASVGPNRLTGAWTTPSADITNVACWHNPDLQRPLELGPIMATLPTFGAECLVIAAFQTRNQAVPKVAV